jgi:hypothetical protein
VRALPVAIAAAIVLAATPALAATPVDAPAGLLPASAIAGFDYPEGVAVAPGGDAIYVADVEGDRVWEITPAGAPASALGARGARAGQLDAPESVAVDPGSGDVYVLQKGIGDLRVDKLTAGGRFLWRVGGGVDETTGGNLCTAREVRAGARCGPGAPSTGAEPGAFKFANQSGDLLAVDVRGQLYVGDEHRVQVFASDGRWQREIPLVSLSAQAHSSVVALALGASGHLYLVYRIGAVETYLPSERADVVYELDPGGALVARHPIAPATAGSVVSVNAIAIDPGGPPLLAALGVEIGVGATFSRRFLSLYDGASGAPLAALPPPPDDDGAAFGGDGSLYVATAAARSVEAYRPAPFSAPEGGGGACELYEGFSPLALESDGGNAC